MLQAGIVEASPVSLGNQVAASAVCRRAIASGLSISAASAISRRLIASGRSISTASAVCRRLIASGLSISAASAISRRLIACGLSLGAAAGFSPTVLANPTSTGVVSVNVPQILEVSASEVNIEVPLAGSAISNLKVGSVNIKSNASNGYKLTVTSASDGVLKMTDNSVSNQVPYTLSYDGASVVSLRGTAETPLAVENKTSAHADFLACATKAGCTRSVTVNVKESDVNNKPAGMYKDTLKFNIIAN